MDQGENDKGLTDRIGTSKRAQVCQSLSKKVIERSSVQKRRMREKFQL